MTHILLIEPDVTLAHTYGQALRHVGHSVALAHTAQQAVDLADEQLPSVVILELQLANHDGVEFLHEFRSYPEWQRVPVVVNTTLPPTSLVPIRHALAQSLGVAQCLYKPRVTLQQLVGVVNKHLAMPT